MKLRELLDNMTFEEKCSLLTGGQPPWRTAAPSVRWAARRAHGRENGCGAFPKCVYIRRIVG